MRIRPEIAALPAYKQGRQAGADAFKLSSNENPFEPLPSVVAAVQTAVAFNRYPDATASRLRARLAERYGVGDDAVHIAAGSVSILYQLTQATSGPGDEILFSWRSFEAYPGLAVVAGATSVMVPNDARGGHDLDAMADAITDRTRMVIVCTPNNPTGPVVTQAASPRRWSAQSAGSARGSTTNLEAPASVISSRRARSSGRLAGTMRRGSSRSGRRLRMNCASTSGTSPPSA